MEIEGPESKIVEVMVCRFGDVIVAIEQELNSNIAGPDETQNPGPKHSRVLLSWAGPPGVDKNCPYDHDGRSDDAEGA